LIVFVPGLNTSARAEVYADFVPHGLAATWRPTLRDVEMMRNTKIDRIAAVIR
jgi:hypothetical protein